jgi:DNA primase large subunit
MKPILEKYLPLDSNSSGSTKLAAQRQKDHYSHFILRLAFSSTEDLRRRFARVETMLFRIRFNNDSLADRSAFVAGLNFDWWHPVSDEEKRKYAAELAAMAGTYQKNGSGSAEDEGWFRVDWERVPELVEGRRVFLKAGKAFVPVREQSSMVVAEFTTRLEKQLAVR